MSEVLFDSLINQWGIRTSPGTVEKLGVCGQSDKKYKVKLEGYRSPRALTVTLGLSEQPDRNPCEMSTPAGLPGHRKASQALHRKILRALTCSLQVSNKSSLSLSKRYPKLAFPVAQK